MSKTELPALRQRRSYPKLLKAQIVDKGLPTAGLLAQVLVAKFAGYLPLYHQEGIFACAGLALSRSTLGE